MTTQKWVRQQSTYTSLNELQGTLILADLEQFNDSLLVWLQAGDLTDQITNESGVLVLLKLVKKGNVNLISAGSVGSRPMSSGHIPMECGLVFAWMASQPCAWWPCDHGGHRWRSHSRLVVYELVGPFLWLCRFISDKLANKERENFLIWTEKSLVNTVQVPRKRLANRFDWDLASIKTDSSLSTIVINNQARTNISQWTDHSRLSIHI